MKCQQARSLLSGYLDQELAVEEMRRLAAHLDQCHACASELNALQQTQSLLANLASPRPRSDFWQDAYGSLNHTPMRPVPLWHRLKRWQRSTLVATPALALASLLLLLWSPTPPAPTPSVDDLDELVHAHLNARATQPFADGGQVRMLLADEPGNGDITGSGELAGE